MKQDSKICTAQAQEARLVPSGGPVVAIKALACLSLILGLIGCGGGGSAACSAGLGVLASGSCPSEAANNAPTARTGAIQNVQVGTLVFLDGSASTDPESSPITYKWTFTSKPAGSAADLAPSASPRPSFIADVEGLYSATLVVSDGKVSSAVASTSVVASVNNAAPVAVAGTAQNVLVGASVSLNGTGSTDANSDALTFKWSMIGRPTGSAAALSYSTSPVPSFTADVAGNYVISLMVNDGRVDSALSAVTVTASAVTTNAAPVAKTGLAQFVTVASNVTLDGTASSDANKDFLTYKWSFISIPTDSRASLSTATSSKATFTADLAGVYVATLIVNDGKVDSAIVVTTVTASSANSTPVAVAGANRSVTPGAPVELDGSGSKDADSDTLKYKWYLTYKPTGSAAALSSDTEAKPTFTTDFAGIYVASLVVSDGKATSSVATTTILANTAPEANAGSTQSVAVAVEVTLDGTGSKDADSDTLSYKWVMTTRPTGSSAALSSANASKPTFTPDFAGIYVFTLVVNDGKVDSSNTSIVAVSAS